MVNVVLQNPQKASQDKSGSMNKEKEEKKVGLLSLLLLI